MIKFVGEVTRTRLLAGVFVVLAVMTAPLWLRTVSFFDIRRVEVLGTRYLDAATIARRLALEPGRSLFDALEPLEDRVSGVAGIAAVEIVRGLPATLRVVIVERVPVALVPGPDGMIALDADARPLPYDPATVELDLPVVATSDRGLTAAIALVRGLDSEMYASVVGLRRDALGNVELEFGEQRVVLNQTPTIRQILKVTAVRRHMNEVSAQFDKLDVRFAGQVVAHRSGV